MSDSTSSDSTSSDSTSSDSTSSEGAPRPSAAVATRRFSWRRWLVNWHRDIGFLIFGLTLAYAISGIAVNHHGDWNPNEHTRRKTHDVGQPAALLDGLDEERRASLAADPISVTDAEAKQLVAALSRALSRPPARHYLWRDPSRLQVFYGDADTDTVEYRLTSGVAIHIERRERRVLRDLNYLHLNEARGVWTWVADAYAAALLFLAVSGVAIVRGRKGLRGRGGLLLALGLVVPLVAIVLLRYVGGS